MVSEPSWAGKQQGPNVWGPRFFHEAIPDSEGLRPPHPRQVPFAVATSESGNLGN